MTRQQQPHTPYDSARRIIPTQRNLHFNVPAEQIASWNNHSMHLSHFLNSLSIFFPVGERFFIDSVRNYRDAIADPDLKRAVKAFIGQEAMHGREHEQYNEALFRRVPAARAMEKMVDRLLRLVQKLPKSSQLSTTIALEHFTAILADALLNEPRILENAEPHYARLWIWHALEETEHKSVAFDVWLAVRGRGPLAYLQRSMGLIVATIIFWAIAIPFYLRILGHERQLSNARGWREILRYAFGEIGVLRKLVRPWADYFRPSFHPWDHDNQHQLARLKSLTNELERVA
ncbi:MAG: metal-dependent hydrolase [Alcanivoracaceae bacterium]|jgi:predicted metal-dependent hydrolase|nr:metal-dependent hydrolase [Alcanivoracaceae bacterium]